MHKFQLEECDIETRAMLFKVYVKPNIDYGIEIWQMPGLESKFERYISPIFFQGLKKSLGIAFNINNHRLLNALNL